MPPKSDAQLLREYAEHGSEAAFAEIASRHTNLVYSAALRQVDSPDLAAEISQRVFIALARGAGSLLPKLTGHASLAGWLCRCARNMSLNLRRDEFRRQSRERLAMEHHDIPEATADWDHLRPLLDEAMSELNGPDYEALVMRFFQNQDLRSVGHALGLSDNTAQKRVSRALDKLRERLARRGITTTAAALSVVLSANAVQAAPTGLAASISTATALVGTTIPAATTATAVKTIAMTTLQKTLVGAALVAAVGTGIYEANRAAQFRDRNQTLQQQQATLAAQIRQLERDGVDATNRLALLAGEISELRSNSAELLRLRNEVTSLRQTAAGPEPVADPVESSARDWLRKVNLAKSKFEQWPDKKIPELVFLSDYDWLQSVRGIGLDQAGEMTWRHILARLRATAKMNFSHALGDALQDFIADHDGQLPAQLSQLNAYYTVYSERPAALDPPLLERYELLQSGNLADIKYTEPLIAEKTPPVDERYDTRFQLTAYGYEYSGVATGSNRVPDLGTGMGPFNHPEKIRKYRKE